MFDLLDENRRNGLARPAPGREAVDNDLVLVDRLLELLSTASHSC